MDVQANQDAEQHTAYSLPHCKNLAINPSCLLPLHTNYSWQNTACRFLSLSQTDTTESLPAMCRYKEADQQCHADACKSSSPARHGLASSFPSEQQISAHVRIYKRYGDVTAVYALDFELYHHICLHFAYTLNLASPTNSGAYAGLIALRSLGQKLC